MFNISKLLMAGAVAIMSLTAVPALAGNCDQIAVPGLTDSQIIDLKKKCVEMNVPSVAANVVEAVSTENLSQYAELGQKYGIALSEVAKSIGVTVNDLAQTPVGKFMLVMVAYKVMGTDLLGVVGSVIWFTLMLPLWVYMFHRLVLSTRSIKETFGADGKLTSRVLSPLDWRDGYPGPISFTMLIVLVAVCGAGFVMAF